MQTVKVLKVRYILTVWLFAHLLTYLLTYLLEPSTCSDSVRA